MEFYSGNKFLSVEGFLLENLTVSIFTVMDWPFMSHMGLRYAYCIYDQNTLLLVSLVKSSNL